MIHTVSHGLALAFLAGPWSREALLERGREVLGEKPAWLALLVGRVLERFATAPADGEAELVAMLEHDTAFRQAALRAGPALRVRRWLLPEPAMVAVAGPPACFAVAHLPSVGSPVVVRLDLEDFFAAIGRGRVAAIFRRLGYPREVAATLAGLCTVATPEIVLDQHPREGTDLGRRFLANQRLRNAHLPQGAPTSPALANLAAFHLDLRLGALAKRFGATMSRYADDIAFSGDRAFDRTLPHFLVLVGAIALEEGFHINYRKTLVMRRSEQQRLCGLVVNERPNLPRREFDRLKALLCNAVRFGPESQNRDRHQDFRRHLEGRISWVTSIHPARGQRLRELFEKMCWP